MNTLKKAALGLSTTVIAVGGSLIAVPAAHAAPAPVDYVSALRFKLDNNHTCLVNWGYKAKDVLFELKEKDLTTGEVRKAVYPGDARRGGFSYRHPNHRFRYSVRVSKGGVSSAWKSDVCGKA